jgi:site-specific DNA recombinase
MTDCIIYTRKSDEQAQADDFEIQEEVCRKYAESKGYNIVAKYREAHSGKHSPMTRLIMKQAIQDIKEHRASVIVIRTYDRLARESSQMFYWLFQIEEIAHGRVEAAEQQIDRNDPMVKLQFQVLAAALEIERNTVVSRLDGGKRKRAARGYLMGSPNARYGYRWVDNEPGKRTAYEVDEVSGAIVRQMFRWASEGKSMHQMARELNKSGIPTPSTYAKQFHNPGNRMVAKYWHEGQIKVILQDERYAGKPVAYRTKTTRDYRDDREKEYMVTKLSDEPMELPIGTWPALITSEQFKAVQARLATNRAGRKPADVQVALFRGHVYCGVCGSRMHSMKAPNSDQYIYACSKRRSRASDPSEACPGGGFNIRCRTADERGWLGVKYVLVNRVGFIQMLHDQVHSEQSKDDLATHVQTAIGALHAKQEERTNLVRSLGMIKDDDLRQETISLMEAVSIEVKKLEKQALEAQKEMDDAKAGDALIDSIVDQIYGWHEEWVKQTRGGDYNWPSDAQMSDFDQMPWDLKRLAVERSGIHLKVYPVGWRQEHEGLPSDAARVVVVFQYGDIYGESTPSSKIY